MSIFESGDIWNSAAFSDFESPLKDLLDSGEFNLVDLLDQNELLQELKASENEGMLIDFLSDADNLLDLLNTIVLVPSSSSSSGGSTAAAASVDANAHVDQKHIAAADEDEEEEEEEEDVTMGYEITETDKPMTSESFTQFATETNYEIMDNNNSSYGNTAMISSNQNYNQNNNQNEIVRHPYMACEIICCECPPIIHTICNDTSLLDCLFRILEAEVGELDDRTAGYFEKILTALIRHQAALITAYIDGLGMDLIRKLIHHIGSFSIAQILQRLLMPAPPTVFDFTEDTNSQQSNDCDENDENENEEDDDENPIIDGDANNNQRLLRCRWSGNVDAIRMLLNQKLISDEVDGEVASHASDLLVSLVQQSPLDSELLMAFTSAPILDAIVGKAIRIPLSDFIPYDTPSTCAVQLLEALVLQLGGYGCVAPLDESITYLLGLSSAADDEDENENLNENENEVEENRQAEEFDKSMEVVAMNNGHDHDHRQNENEDEPEKDAARTTTTQNENDVTNNSTTMMPANSNRKRIATPTHLKSLIQTCLKPLKDMLQIDERNSKYSSSTWQTAPQIGGTHRLLGSSRLRIVRFIESLVLLSQPDLDLILIESGILEVALDLFLSFEWCSMLHQSVANLLVHVIEGGDNRKTLQTYLIHSTDLLQKLLEAYDRNEEIYDCMDTPKNPNAGTFRLGYMGHIIIICQAIEHACHITTTITTSSSSFTEEQLDNNKEEDQLDEEEEEMVIMDEQLNSDILTDDCDTTTANDNETPPVVITEHDVTSAANHTNTTAAALHHTTTTTTTSTNTTSHLAQTILESEVYTKWEEFTRTDLREITTMQSTPLGSNNNNRNFDLNMNMNGTAHNVNLHVDDTDLDVAMGMMGELYIIGAGGGSSSAAATGEMNVAIDDDDVVSGMYAFDKNPLGTQKQNDIFMDNINEEEEVEEDDDFDEEEQAAVPTMDLFVANVNSNSTNDAEEDWTANFSDAFGSASSSSEEAVEGNKNAVASKESSKSVSIASSFDVDFTAFEVGGIADAAKKKDDEEEDVFSSSSTGGGSVDDILFG